jgi:hypothetical protein
MSLIQASKPNRFSKAEEAIKTAAAIAAQTMPKKARVKPNRAAERGKKATRNTARGKNPRTTLQEPKNLRTCQRFLGMYT